MLNAGRVPVQSKEHLHYSWTEEPRTRDTRVRLRSMVDSEDPISANSRFFPKSKRLRAAVDKVQGASPVMESNSLANPIRLTDGVSTDDISNWGRGSENLLLKATRDSKFATFCEGVALGKVSELGRNASGFRLSTTFHIFQSGDALVACDLGILGGLFGLSVAFAGASVIDPTGTDLRTQLLEELWNRVQEADGVVAP